MVCYISEDGDQNSNISNISNRMGIQLTKSSREFNSSSLAFNNGTWPRGIHLGGFLWAGYGWMAA